MVSAAALVVEEVATVALRVLELGWPSRPPMTFRVEDFDSAVAAMAALLAGAKRPAAVEEDLPAAAVERPAGLCRY